MELHHIGKNCCVCNRNDYLPFKCNHCDKIVCIDHKSNHGSGCPYQIELTSKATIEPNKLNQGSNLKAGCDFCKKITLKLELSECSHCHMNNCLYHRHQIQHDCSQLAVEAANRKEVNDSKIARQSEALEKLRAKINHDTSKQQISTATTNKIVDKPIVDPKKLALSRRINIMKIKQTAKGPPNIDMDQRLYFQVKFIHEPKAKSSPASKDGAMARIFASTKHTIGRLIDWSADELKLINKNDIIGSDMLQFAIRLADGTILELDSLAPFSRYIETNQLASGDEILLTYVPNDKT